MQKRFFLRNAADRLAAFNRFIDSGSKPGFVNDGKNTAEATLDFIRSKAQLRKYSDAEMIFEYYRLREILAKLKSDGKPIKGKARQYIAEVLNVSPAQIGKLDYIRNNAIPEVERAVKDGSMSISTANEVAKLTSEKQAEVMAEKPDISRKPTKEM